jgi:hypothetical protein
LNLSAQTVKDLIVPYLPQGHKLNGNVTKEKYAGAIELDLKYEVSPGTNTPSPFLTKGYIFRTDQSLIVGFYAEFDPENFRANLQQRDEAWDDDIIGIALDVYGDTRNMVFLGSNAFGVQLDVRKNDPANPSFGNEFDESFDCNYETWAKRYDSSYTVEMRIPFNSLQFGNSNEQRWKFAFWRKSFNGAQEITIQTFFLDRAIQCEDCQYSHALILDGIKPKLRSTLLPYAFSAVGSEPNDEISSVTKFGGSAFVALSPATSIEAALIPDFSQVEADVAQVAINSPFALFYPERRPFFIEGSDLLESRLKYVYTRTISQPSALSKLNFQSKKIRFYALTGYDPSSPYLVPGENYSAVGTTSGNWSTILRAEHPMANASSVGFMSTHRIYDEGGFGHTIALDLNNQINPRWRYKIELARTETQEPQSDWITSGEKFSSYTPELDGERFSGYSLFSAIYRQSTNWKTRADIMLLSPTFRPEMGFEPRNNRRRFEIGQQYRGFPNKKYVKNYSIYAETSLYTNYENVVKERSTFTYSRIQLSGNINLSFNAKFIEKENYLNIDYENLFNGRLNISWSPNQAFSLGAGIGGGRQIAYNETNPRIGISRRRGVDLDLQAKGKFQWSLDLDYEEMNELYDPAISIYKGFLFQSVFKYTLTRALDFRLVSQLNNFDSGEINILMQPLIQYRPSAFSLFYLGGMFQNGQFQGYLKWQKQIGN